MSTAVITFGRFNPVTTGHEKLVNKVKEIARVLDADPLVYLSHSHGPKNPIPYSTKIFMAKLAFGDCIIESDARNIFMALPELEGAYDNIVVVVGGDRLETFKETLNKYKNDYSFHSIMVVSAGSRNPDSDGIDGVSASKMREYAKTDDFAYFKLGLPKALQPTARTVFNLCKNEN